jgi:NitT/TauT family transport system ATP-binding protein
MSTSAQSMTGAPDVPPEPLAALQLESVTKVFGRGAERVLALDGVDLQVRPGEFVCLVGASGCGKSTLLNLIAGLDRPTTGRVDVRAPTTLMFQEAALFPWLTVAGNIDLALQLRGVARRDRPDRIAALLRSVQLDGFDAKRPHELSGGMRQRVAIARAFAQDVDILLMDEPFGALDAMTRDVLHDELERLWADRSLSVVFVTHNVREAVRLADRVVLLSSRPGRVVEQFPVDVPRPRRIESAEVSGLAADITTRLREEVRRHANDRVA